MKQTKTTKNKYLRRLVRDYEIERNRPRGTKLLDLILRSIKLETSTRPTFFVSNNVWEECNGVTKYQGFNIVNSPAIKKSTVYLADCSNLFYQECQ